MNKSWLLWAQRIQAIAQAGLEYSRDSYDRERFQQLRGLAVEIVSEYTGIGEERVADLFANESGYQTPKVDVRAVVQSDGRLLFVKEADGKWALPGGWAEPHLSLKENVAKEVLEESGMTVEVSEVIAILDRNRYLDDNYPYSVYKVFVGCRFLGGRFERNIETSAAQFFHEREVPELSVTRNTERQVEMCFEYINGKYDGVIFD